MEGRVVKQEQVSLFQKIMTDANMSQNTRQKYSRDLYKLVEYLDGEELTQEKLDKYGEWLLEKKKFKERSVNSYIVIANRFCEAMGWTMKAPIIPLSRDVGNLNAKRLSHEEYVHVLQTAIANGMERLAMMIQVFGNTDLRISELSCLTAESLEKGQVEVVRKGETIKIFLPEPLIEKLKEYAVYAKVVNGPLFATSGGMPVNRSNIWKEMKQLSRLAGLEEGRLSARSLKQPFVTGFYSVVQAEK